MPPPMWMAAASERWQPGIASAVRDALSQYAFGSAGVDQRVAVVGVAGPSARLTGNGRVTQADDPRGADARAIGQCRFRQPRRREPAGDHDTGYEGPKTAVPKHAHCASPISHPNGAANDTPLLRNTARMANPPDTHYARWRDARIAYQVWGTGPLDLVAVRSGSAGPVDLLWEERSVVDLLERFGGFARNIWYDQRGLGASSALPPDMGADLDAWIEDIGAVMAAAGSERAALLGIAEGGGAAMLYAATFPERVSALVLINTYARFIRGPDYPLGLPAEKLEPWVHTLEENWGTAPTSSSCARA